ncbi:Ribosomal RNA small subunit methyltransferase H [Caldalkalibacillus thermarum TA2.A1]|uniref:Ribosomal RNA small subunit methyltransferase H n=1 Tax=Caldalkalibacillus thermarum (strain TA2.A1) TaxID=986075 RepID=F5L8Z2_CALTT|nr:16S rRNA (cytosine(1402)-N(4))-methyltransferase RsmH [Caldalkalibacillus thermarum]EGL82166.1 Ribosomal RNA small subunit methyltransferase H [Caldalkalibacillus thermarum TA2.A1]QZT33120.1 16S rRNA (cytosine(1402)-N(4))-methyltransferase RsmH [Caldalkalibacillus thermarum TA2.A1]GGK15632.1 ribosomal RNA small subunit methyltransferase H [Caldalkalibacillus thermarum]
MFEHVTVLKEEAVNGLNIKSDGTYVDCTLGGAGHSQLIASRLGPGGCLIGIDQDQEALEHARRRLANFNISLVLVQRNFRYLAEILDEAGFQQVDGVLFDLGVSSPQLDQAERGFSYQHDAPLDMRMDQRQDLTAFDVVNSWSEEQLAEVIYRYGEERYSRRIARRIVETRKKKPIKTTGELVDVIKQSIPAKARQNGPHPAKRTFQAIRIAVNDELNAFEEALSQAIERLNKGGRVAVITFHSLEDRICKQMFRQKSQGCTCPPGLPQCVCGQVPSLKIVNRKPIVPTLQEVEQNPRARSAKLRIAEKI